jgi:hypothetical protein
VIPYRVLSASGSTGHVDVWPDRSLYVRLSSAVSFRILSTVHRPDSGTSTGLAPWTP